MMFFILGGMYKTIDVSLLSSNKKKVYNLLLDKKKGDLKDTLSMNLKTNIKS